MAGVSVHSLEEFGPEEERGTASQAIVVERATPTVNKTLGTQVTATGEGRDGGPDRAQPRSVTFFR